MSSAKDVVKQIKDGEIEWVDLRFTDPKGKWQHLQMHAGVMDEDALEDGLMFDGSSISGWKTINESDMILKPDLSTTYIDPFSATPMMVLCCNIVEPSDGQLYARDPRSAAEPTCYPCYHVYVVSRTSPCHRSMRREVRTREEATV